VLKKVRGTGHDRCEKREIATIGGGADLKINMIERKISQIRPEELGIHEREKTQKVELQPDSLYRWHSFCNFHFHCFYSL
jgi:hypothetical protein